VFRGDASEVGELVAPGGREVEGVCAPVGRVASSLGQSALLEVVHERDHGAAVDSERVAEGLLGLALEGGKVAEDSEVPRVEVDSGEALGEAPVRVGAQLSEQEAGTAAELLRWGGVRDGGISGHCHPMVQNR